MEELLKQSFEVGWDELLVRSCGELEEVVLHAGTGGGCTCPVARGCQVIAQVAHVETQKRRSGRDSTFWQLCGSDKKCARARTGVLISCNQEGVTKMHILRDHFHHYTQACPQVECVDTGPGRFIRYTFWRHTCWSRTRSDALETNRGIVALPIARAVGCLDF